MNNVNYKTLKSIIIKACKAVKPGKMEFEIDYDKLVDLAKDIKLVPVCAGLNCKHVKPDVIPFMSEYFEKSHLSWFTAAKFYTVLTFVDSESIDEKAQELLDKIKTPQMDDPDDDKVQDLATLVAEYPCYFANIVSYQNNDPKRVGRPSYEIICRANKVVIRNSDYQYNHADFS